ncbi:peptidoglycan recognition protein family protein [Auraticoccus monumenti]|uniref:N-acetylmuramoyl-L-alanine amidase n=1 Tax=Auraticoccus monumenti TaxID=675864 RepID=A0A1G6UGE7_9ACTN|nr:N-acetylmuramoyl-L-alanine amidase [Auraticoccus monumenti]SDD40341.1 N-acetylmuramoyl-L-alanine amidase [Auraticoccus monumenti]
MARPMTPAQWRAQMQKWKVPHAFVDGWEGNGRPAYTGPFNDVVGILVHHTGSWAQSAAYLLFLFFSGRSDLPGPLCQAATNAKGITYIGATGRANHAGKGSVAVFDLIRQDAMPLTREVTPGPDSVDGNARFYGNEVMFDGSSPMTDAQYACLVLWCAAVCDFHGWDGRSIGGHGEWTRSKWDPGETDMARLRRDVNARLADGPPGTLKPTTPVVTAPPATGSSQPTTPTAPEGILGMTQYQNGTPRPSAQRQRVGVKQKARLKVTADTQARSGVHQIVRAVPGQLVDLEVTLDVYDLRKGEDVRARIVLVEYAPGKAGRVVYAFDQVQEFGKGRGRDSFKVTQIDRCGKKPPTGGSLEYQLELTNHSSTTVQVGHITARALFSEES